jgi:uncharacterized protein
MDDANVPSLLSIPICSREVLAQHEHLIEVYDNTRRFLLSNDNPFFFRTDSCSGIGSVRHLRHPRPPYPTMSFLQHGGRD